MSVKDRIVDAQVLYANGRKEGALLSVLVAVAATSRKRYPRHPKGKKDGDAFTTFLGEELTKVLRIGQFNIKFRDEMITLQELLYKFVRCNLTHEAELPEDIKFKVSEQLSVSVDDDCITFSERLFDVLGTVVSNAEENSGEFK